MIIIIIIITLTIIIIIVVVVVVVFLFFLLLCYNALVIIMFSLSLVGCHICHNIAYCQYCHSLSRSLVHSQWHCQNDVHVFHVLGGCFGLTQC